MLEHHIQVFTFISSAFIVKNIIIQVETAPFNIHFYNENDFHNHPIVYRRFIRRLPPIYLNDKYMEEIVEIFYTEEKPPAYGVSMTDEDIDQFIFCDFNRHLAKCKQYWQSKDQLPPFLMDPSTSHITVKPISETHSTTKQATSISATPPETTTEITKIPDLNEDEYIYSDEIVDVEDKQEKNTINGDYLDYYNDEIEV